VNLLKIHIPKELNEAKKSGRDFYSHFVSLIKKFDYEIVGKSLNARGDAEYQLTRRRIHSDNA